MSSSIILVKPGLYISTVQCIYQLVYQGSAGNTRVKALVTQLEAAAHLAESNFAFPYTQMQSVEDQGSDPTLLFTT